MGWRRKAAVGLGVTTAVMLTPLAIIQVLLIIGPMLTPRPGAFKTGTPFDRVSPEMTITEVEAILGSGQPVDPKGVVAEIANHRASAKRPPKPLKIDQTLDFRLWGSSAGNIYLGFRKGRVATRFFLPR